MKATDAMQAKDISDTYALEALAKVRGLGGVADWSSWFDVRDALPLEIPPKVMLAKLRSMIRRGVIDGCACGCRGDFRLRAFPA